MVANILAVVNSVPNFVNERTAKQQNPPNVDEVFPMERSKLLPSDSLR
jgi:hypothetical protein